MNKTGKNIEPPRPHFNKGMPDMDLHGSPVKDSRQFYKTNDGTQGPKSKSSNYGYQFPKDGQSIQSQPHHAPLLNNQNGGYQSESIGNRKTVTPVIAR